MDGQIPTYVGGAVQADRRENILLSSASRGEKRSEGYGKELQRHRVRNVR